MCNKFLLNILITTCGILFLFLVPHHTNANDIYKWTDENGNVHFTDNPSLIPKGKAVEVEIIEKLKDGRLEHTTKSNLPSPTPSGDSANGVEEESERDKEQAIREYWRTRALDIDNKEKRLLEDISLTKRLIIYKKREVDDLLGNGYSADHSIFELRNLEDRLNHLEFNLGLIKPEREKLEDEARRAGIPPGYLRP
ncbi:MAG: DUF4124 domain-containing protein [Deltaproteobacteria bacterium]|nr:DUF4124 domain-containing protein [Deltaproteobacteria bacterium]